ncbi:hypothetical protein A7B70_14620 [Listeria monocytogenes]|nr:hypothetical protein [Listeria monocytogenes]
MAFKKLIFVLIIAALFLNFKIVAEADTNVVTLAANEAVVTSFDELKKVISEDNGIDTVYLGADVALSGGIKIPDSKKTFTLSGKNPITGEIHTLRETMSSGTLQSSVITVNTNVGTKETNVKDINIIGKNYYGTISVYGAAKNVVQNYENIHYQGPQMIYNLNGTAHFSGDNSISIVAAVSGTATVSEVAETKGVTVSGKLSIEHSSTGHSIFWFGSGTSEVNSFIVEENANVNVVSNGMGMFYRSGTKPVDIHVKKNAKVNITSDDDIFRVTGGSVRIDEGADVEMTKTAGANPLLELEGDITVSPNARLILEKTGGTSAGYIIRFRKAEGRLDVQNPRSFLITTTTNAPMFYWPYTNTFSLDTQMVHYWDTVGDIERTDLPIQRFILPSGGDVTGTLTYSGTTTKILSTNAGMTPTNFDLNKARMIAMGRLEGTINPITDADSEITGTATPNSFVSIHYKENGLNKVLESHTNDSGTYRITIPSGFIKPYTDVTTRISQDQKWIMLDAVKVGDVTPPSGKAVPQILTLGESFPDVSKIVTDISDHSDNTVGAGITTTLISGVPDTNVFGPTIAIVRLKDRENNHVDIRVPVFIKDDATDVKDAQALRAADFSVNVKEIIQLDDMELQQLILTKSRAKAFNIETGVDLTAQMKVTNTNLKKETGSYKATIQIGTLTKEIAIQVTGELKFNHVPKTISFESIELNNQKNTANLSPGFDLSVLDSRGGGNQFRVTATMKSPLTSTTNPAHTLPGSLVFIDSIGKKELSEQPITVFESQSASNMITPIEWAKDQGIFVEVDVTKAYVDENYESIIEWTLTDAP